MKNKIIKTLLVISLINTYLPLNAFWPFAKKYSHKDVPLSFVEEFYNDVSKLPWTRQVPPLEIALAKLAFEDAKLEEMTATDSRSLITKEDQRYYEEIENLSALITTNTDQLEQILNNLPGIKQSPENLIFLITTIDEIPSIHQRAYDITSQFQQKQLAIIGVHFIYIGENDLKENDITYKEIEKIIDTAKIKHEQSWEKYIAIGEIVNSFDQSELIKLKEKLIVMRDSLANHEQTK